MPAKPKKGPLSEPYRPTSIVPPKGKPKAKAKPKGKPKGRMAK
jgi:hypothetical protein